MKIISKIQEKLPRRQEPAEDFSELESQLHAAMQPIEPNPDFVSTLESRILQNYPSQQLAAQAQQQKPRVRSEHLLFGAAGIVSFALAIFASLRLAIAIISSIGLLLHLLQDYRGKRVERPAKAAA